MQKRMSDSAREAQLKYEAGDFQKAIDISKEIHQKHGEDPAARDNYVRVVESIKMEGDQAFEGGHFALAEKVYETLSQNWVHFDSFSLSLSFRKEFLEERIRDSRRFLIDRQIRCHLESGDLQKAMDIHKEIYQRYPGDPAIRGDYTKTIESIKNSGDRALENMNFTLAENIYRVLIENWPDFADLGHSLSFNKALLEQKIRTGKRLFTEKEVQAYLKAGDYKRAIDLHKQFYQKYPQDPVVRSGFIKTLESIKRKADRTFEKNDLATAGSIYDALSKMIPSPFVRSLSFNREDLIKKIGICKKILFGNGLEQYRAGNLNQAVSIWKSILTFDPEDEEIRKAVGMATLQIKNLDKAL